MFRPSFFMARYESSFPVSVISGPVRWMPRISSGEDDRNRLTGSAEAGSSAQTRWVVGLAMLVGLVGVINAMLLSVTERFAEIGTMKVTEQIDALTTLSTNPIRYLVVPRLVAAVISMPRGVTVSV